MIESSRQESLRRALDLGELAAVRALIDAGADIRYTREHGYDALIDAVHGCDNGQLLELLALLVERGVNLSGVTSYGESGLRVLSRLGRFDAVRLLLDAGADRRQLEWTALMEAVALGTLTDVQAAIDAGELLEARDCWSRTAWLIALLAGDIDKARLLMEHGADTTARGRCGAPPLFYAIQGLHPNMLRWLLSTAGADYRHADHSGRTALAEAAACGELECVELVLAAGADPLQPEDSPPLRSAATREIALRLLSAGANPAHADQRLILGLADAESSEGEAMQALDEVSGADFAHGEARIFGERNPDRMNFPYWIAMIRAGVSAYQGRQHFGRGTDFPGEPGWCARRFGQSLTLLPDGKAIQIGGEHEDYYDPDFCIYNDVFMHTPDGRIEVYGYPKSVFAPTDFHTATLVGDAIIIIGSLGYAGTREYNRTPVYRLDLGSLQIERLHTTGEAPGWIFNHRAERVGDNSIRVWGGSVVTKPADKESNNPNLAAFRLDLQTLVWSKLEV